MKHLLLFEIAVHGRVLVVDQQLIWDLVRCEDHIRPTASSRIGLLPARNVATPRASATSPFQQEYVQRIAFQRI
ncbi:hypothetical protein BN903_57 [Halorubrum sp. AJ67]|nr:hypothetical protein BN903_57 [Halorubrum sp. AJ67]